MSKRWAQNGGAVTGPQYAVRGCSETQAQIFPTLSCASGGVHAFRSHLSCASQHPHSLSTAAAFREASSGAHPAWPSRSTLGASCLCWCGALCPGSKRLPRWGTPPPWCVTRVLLGRCLQRGDNLEATEPQGLSNQGWAQNSRLPDILQGIRGCLGLRARPGLHSASTAALWAPGLLGR